MSGMPYVPAPSEDEIRELLEPIRAAAQRKRAAEQDYRAAIAHAHRRQMRPTHIAPYAGTSPQAVTKTLARIQARAEAERVAATDTSP